MFIAMFIIMFIIMMAVSVAMYETLRKSRPFGWFVRIIDKSFLLQMMFHFAIALGISALAGHGMVAGGANLASTAAFPIYCTIRNRINPTYRQINGSFS